MAPHNPPQRAPRLWVMLLPLIAAALLRDLWAPDEPRRAQVALELWQAGDPWVLRLCGHLYPDKPPLFFWITALLGAVSNWNAAALRIVSLAASAGTAFWVARMGRHLFSDKAGDWAACCFLGCALITFEGARLNIDPLFMFLCTSALAGWVVGPSSALGQTLWVGVATGLAALTKGPVAYVNVGLVGVLWWIARGRPRLAFSHVVLGLFLSVAPVLAWASVMALRAPETAYALFFDQHVGRVLRAEDHAGPPWKHLWRLPLLLLPWTPFVLRGLRRAWLLRSSSWLLPALWLVALLTFFSAIPVKRDLYLLPLYPAAALLAGAVLAESSPDQLSAPRRLVSALLVIMGAGLIFAATRAEDFAPGTDSAAPLLVSGVVMAAGALLSMRVHARGVQAWAQSIAMTWCACLTLVGLWLFPALDPIKSARALAGYLAERPEQPSAIPCIEVQPEGYRFYGGIPTVRSRDFLPYLAAEQEQFLGMTRERSWKKFSPELRSRFEVLHRQQVGSKSILVLGQAGRAGTEVPIKDTK